MQPISQYSSNKVAYANNGSENDFILVAQVSFLVCNYTTLIIYTSGLKSRQFNILATLIYCIVFLHAQSTSYTRKFVTTHYRSNTLSATNNN